MNTDNKYREALFIWNNLSEQEKLWVTPHGCFVDSPRLICRFIKYINNKPVGFIDAYNLKQLKDDNYKKPQVAFIVIAVLEKYRHQGIASELMKELENKLQNKGYKCLEYIVNKENKLSIIFALKHNFKFIKETETQEFFKKNIYME